MSFEPRRRSDPGPTPYEPKPYGRGRSYALRSDSASSVDASPARFLGSVSDPSSSPSNSGSNTSSVGTNGSVSVGSSRKRRSWTREEDEKLTRAVQTLGSDSWQRIAEAMGRTRTRDQCYQRWVRALRPGIRKGAWTEEEDEILRTRVEIYGVGCWREIAKGLDGRTDQQCRRHWSLVRDKDRLQSRAQTDSPGHQHSDESDGDDIQNDVRNENQNEMDVSSIQADEAEKSAIPTVIEPCLPLFAYRNLSDSTRVWTVEDDADTTKVHPALSVESVGGRNSLVDLANIAARFSEMGADRDQHLYSHQEDPQPQPLDLPESRHPETSPYSLHPQTTPLSFARGIPHQYSSQISEQNSLHTQNIIQSHTHNQSQNQPQGQTQTQDSNLGGTGWRISIRSLLN